MTNRTQVFNYAEALGTESVRGAEGRWRNGVRDLDWVPQLPCSVNRSWSQTDAGVVAMRDR